ncbi:hypothetical protein K438DRAFT_1848226 [Mycena galopus ATCC 62051]|nr:hypothetical protein K438DRAFT_1848226 [Mycena galopus ATCC 62051]
MDLGTAQPCWKTEDVDEKVETALAEISALTERMCTLETSVGEELQEVSMWCRDQFNGLWEETAVMGDKLGIVQDELCTVQRRLKEITVAATTRNKETHVKMDMLGRRIPEIKDSSSRDRWDLFDGGADNVNDLHKGIFNELGMVKDELGWKTSEMNKKILVLCRRKCAVRLRWFRTSYAPSKHDYGRTRQPQINNRGIRSCLRVSCRIG